MMSYTRVSFLIHSCLEVLGPLQSTVPITLSADDEIGQWELSGWLSSFRVSCIEPYGFGLVILFVFFVDSEIQICCL